MSFIVILGVLAIILFLFFREQAVRYLEKNNHMILNPTENSDEAKL
ncbi:hypothetical protein [Gracilibacillus kekensis]|uniref:Uncharacterized protein n=1 Tax=Gracilibacillus kekensis TaxID=1027249 RepID=A0A1M7NTY2_9BACI|nr:hypothetical protein [Gracilibacillus kekensis]SHN07494.1 hypothetical protein SAMN05216179_1760 [Gracilibacillus kekensis]